jgi:hypothetical protein
MQKFYANTGFTAYWTIPICCIEIAKKSVILDDLETTMRKCIKFTAYVWTEVHWVPPVFEIGLLTT